MPLLLAADRRMAANLELVLALEGFDNELFTTEGKVRDELAARSNGADVELMNRLGATVVAVRRLKAFANVHGLRSLIGLFLFSLSLSLFLSLQQRRQ